VGIYDYSSPQKKEKEKEKKKLLFCDVLNYYRKIKNTNKNIFSKKIKTIK
jgi:hypothetical protein